MLYWLLYPLHDQVPLFNVFRYITFRAAYAMVTALLISFILGPWMIGALRLGPAPTPLMPKRACPPSG